jgi:pyridinium-3,5-biscarboxylic acid mononucleotide sulfurtransferase
MNSKVTRLKNIIKETGSAVVAYSGGVDSTYLAYIANAVLGKQAIIVMGYSPIYPPYELENATEIAGKLGWNYRIIETTELLDPNYKENTPVRCYHCKLDLFTKLQNIAKTEGAAQVIEGSNQDDLNDFRPGFKACEELKIRSPLLEAGLTKQEIRLLSKKAGLPTWDKPSFSCLATRIPYGTPINFDILTKIEKGEKYLLNLGIRQVRLRHHGDIARIEVDPSSMALLIEDDVRLKVVKEMKSLGYHYVTLDLAGYRTGSMNEILYQEGDAD